MLAHLIGDLLSKARAAVVHRQKDRRQVQAGVQVLLDHADAAQKLAQTLERVVLALDGDQQLARGGEGIDGEQPQRGGQSMRTMSMRSDVVARKSSSAVRRRCAHLRHEFDLCSGEVDRAGSAQQIR
jgi:hypothetical protein